MFTLSTLSNICVDKVNKFKQVLYIMYVKFPRLLNLRATMPHSTQDNVINGRYNFYYRLNIAENDTIFIRKAT